MEKLMRYVTGTNHGANYNELFNAAAENIAKTLSFETKEEYLAFVKHWKIDYKILSLIIRENKYVSRMNQYSISPDKCAMYDRKYDQTMLKLSEFSEETRNESSKRRDKMIADTAGTDLSFYSRFYKHAYLVQYMLVLRRAGKIVAKNAMSAKEVA